MKYLLRKNSIFYKIFFGCFLTASFVLFSIIIYSLGSIRNQYLESVTNDLMNIGISTKYLIRPYLESGNYDGMDSFIKKIGGELKARITIVNQEGTVLADSEGIPSGMENHKDRPEIMQALRGDIGRSERLSATLKQQMLYIALPVEKEGNVSVVIRSSLPLKGINDLLNHIRERFVIAGCILIFLSFLVAFIISRSYLIPLGYLLDAFKDVSKGHFESRIFLKNEDEFKEIAERFNEMVSYLKTLFTELNNQKGEILAIINSIQEGLLVLDKNGKILLSNSSLMKIIKKEDIEGKYYWEVIRESSFDEIVNLIKSEKESLASELEAYNKTFLCTMSFIPSNEEIVIVWHDVTNIKNLEKLKKDFVVNVSHELKTPLTAIKGFVETLEEGILDSGVHNSGLIKETNNEFTSDFARYIEIIKRHTARLINIVNDLLLLSDLEDAKNKVEFEPVAINETIENTARIFEKLTREKGLQIIIDLSQDIPPVQGDAFKLEQLFINLIDNAIKYTEKGSVAVRTSYKDKNIIVVVEDTGIGIPENEISRIFERFYVVDKSRSRKMGGTGLGLSIVKHIVLLHNGNISVESSTGHGTKFIITFPV